MQGVRGVNTQPGEIRTSQIWIGGLRPRNATFVPPPPGSVIDLLGEMEAWNYKDDAFQVAFSTARASCTDFRSNIRDR